MRKSKLKLSLLNDYMEIIRVLMSCKYFAQDSILSPGVSEIKSECEALLTSIDAEFTNCKKPDFAFLLFKQQLEVAFGQQDLLICFEGFDKCQTQFAALKQNITTKLSKLVKN